MRKFIHFHNANTGKAMGQIGIFANGKEDQKLAAIGVTGTSIAIQDKAQMELIERSIGLTFKNRLRK